MCSRRLTSMDCTPQTSVSLASGWVQWTGVSCRVIRAQEIWKKVKVIIRPAFSWLHTILFWWHFLWETEVGGGSSTVPALTVPGSCFFFGLSRPKGADSFLKLQCSLMVPLILPVPLNSFFTKKFPSNLPSEYPAFFWDSDLYTHFPLPIFPFHVCDYRAIEAERTFLGHLLLLPVLYNYLGS